MPLVVIVVGPTTKTAAQYTAAVSLPSQRAAHPPAMIFERAPGASLSQASRLARSGD
jgi:hypothetical protein